MNVHELTPHQSDALSQALAFARGETEHTLALLCGAAGTGKTFTLGELVRTLLREQRLVAVCTPTHKACGILGAKIGAIPGVNVVTLHTLLGMRLVENDDGSTRCEREGEPTIGRYQIVIIDEASMVNGSFCDMAAKSGARVLFVGDFYQLPPVMPSSSPNGPIVLSPVFRVSLRIVLSEIQRQAAGSPIIALATAIRHWIDACHRPSFDEIRAVLPSASDTVAFAVGDRSLVRYFAEHTLRAGHTCRVITYSNAIVLGHNAAVHAALYGADALPFVAGEPVIAQAEFSTRVLDTGKLERIRNSAELVVEQATAQRHPEHPDVDAVHLVLRAADGKRVRCFAPVDELAFDAAIKASRAWCEEASARVKTLPEEDADRLKKERRRVASETSARAQAFALIRHAYSSTVHKAQGSTYDSVIVDLANLARLTDTAFFLRALYTAVTRAAKFVSIIVPDVPPPPPVLASGGSAGVWTPPAPPGGAVAGQLADATSIERSPA